MVWQKVIAALGLIGSVGLAGSVIQQSFIRTNSSTQLVVTADSKSRQQASDFIPVLLDDNAEIRVQAFKKLQSLDVNVSVQALVQALKDKDWQLRVIAAYTLGRLGSQAESAIPKLSTAIKDENADVQYAAAQALGNIGSEKAVPGLIEALQDEDENVRVSAADALSKLGAKARPAGSALTKALWDGNWLVRNRVTETLAKLGLDSIDIPVLVDSLKESRQTGDGAIISIMIAIDPSTLDNPESFSRFFVKALQDPDPKVRQSAASALGQISFSNFQSYGHEETVDALLLSLKDQNVEVRSNSAEALGHIGRPSDQKKVAEIRSALLTAFDDQDAQVRSSAIDALYGYVLSGAEPVAVEITFDLIKMLKDQDAQVRQSAIDALSAISREDFSTPLPFKPNIYSSLSSMISDRDEGVRQQALQALSYSSDVNRSVFISYLANLVEQKDLEKGIRRSILASVGGELTSSEDGIRALGNAFQDEDLGIRQNAALAMRESELINNNSAIDKAVINVLSQGLQSYDLTIQLDAINGLSKVVGRRSNELTPGLFSSIQAELPALTSCLQSPAKPIRYAAALTINQIYPQQESTIPTLREMLETETEDGLRGNASSALYGIGSSEAALARVETARFENQEYIYNRTCNSGWINIPNKHKVSLVDFLRDSSLRQIIAENISISSRDDNLEKEYLAATVNALIPLLEKEEIKPAFQPIFELKNQDIRGSVAYALGTFFSPNQKKNEAAHQKIIDALTEVVNDSSDNLAVRWMAATSLQNAGVNVDSFFKEKKLVNPKIATCPFPKEGRSPGLAFDRYEGRCLYNTRTGCGDGLSQIYATLRRLLASINSRENSGNKK